MKFSWSFQNFIIRSPFWEKFDFSFFDSKCTIRGKQWCFWTPLEKLFLFLEFEIHSTTFVGVQFCHRLTFYRFFNVFFDFSTILAHVGAPRETILWFPIYLIIFLKTHFEVLKTSSKTLKFCKNFKISWSLQPRC